MIKIMLYLRKNVKLKLYVRITYNEIAWIILKLQKHIIFINIYNHELL